MNPFRLTLRPAALADLGSVMAIERSRDYELYVARSDEEEHRAMLTSPSLAYRVGVGQSGEIEAFAILRGLGDPHLNLYLRRVAVARPDQGLGTAFLSLVLDEAFGPMKPSASILIASPTTSALSGPMRNWVSPATACCARPIGGPTGRAPISS